MAKSTVKNTKKKKKILVKPTEKSTKNSFLAVLLTGLGVMVARGAGSYVDKDYQKYLKFAAGAGGIVLAASTTDPNLKALGVGVGALGMLDGAADIASKAKITNVNLKAALGLQAPTRGGLNCPVKTMQIAPTKSTWTPKTTETRVIDITPNKVNNMDDYFTTY